MQTLAHQLPAPARLAGVIPVQPGRPAADELDRQYAALLAAPSPVVPGGMPALLDSLARDEWDRDQQDTLAAVLAGLAGA